MINVTGMNHKAIYLNADHIEKMEEVPETLITLTNGKKYIVLEATEEVIKRIIEYKRKIFTLGL